MSGKEAFRWAGKLAVLTGASSGIGEAILKDLVKNGVNVLAIARREEKIKEIAQELRGESGKVFPFKADVTKEAELVSAFDWVESNLKQPVHILVNNAGVSILRNTKDGVIDEWRTQFDTNVLSIGICIREHLKSMKRHNFDGGHIININSIVGSRVVDFPGFYVYSATKHAAKVIAEGVRQELLKEKSITKVTNIQPGYTSTHLWSNAADYSQESVDYLAQFARLESSDVSNAVIYALSLPQHVRIHDLSIQATGEFY